MTDPSGPLLSLPPPCLDPDRLARLLRDHWGLTGTLTPLTSERDQNHRLDGPRGSFTVKLANPAEPGRLTDFQTLALVHCARHAPDLPIPGVVPARDGRLVLPTAEGALRVLAWLPGMPLARLPRSPAQARAIGQALGRLDAVLAAFQHPAADHHLLWDIRHAPDLAPLMPALPGDLRPEAVAFLDRFRDTVAPALARLPAQVIHGDFNLHNLLADPDSPARLTGILDFGDMVRSHRICDLAVAASYLIAPEDPLALLGPLVAAYAGITPLTEAEIVLLPDLVTARHVTSLAISSWRAARYPGNADYILRNAPGARAGLAALARIDRARLTGALLAAAEGPAA
jgi:hypothetical protein